MALIFLGFGDSTCFLRLISSKLFRRSSEYLIRISFSESENLFLWAETAGVQSPDHATVDDWSIILGRFFNNEIRVCSASELGRGEEIFLLRPD